MDKTFQDVINYDTNSLKTDNMTYVSTFECDKETAATEFLLSKQLYTATTNRKLPKHKDNLMYSMLQSFKPDEVTPELAHKIGYELAMEFTGGKHQFVVSTHTDKDHIHTHIKFNAVTLDCKSKFVNYHNSAKALSKISDRLCEENGLSVIENPLQKGMSYGEWKHKKQGTSWKEYLRYTIDSLIPDCKTFDELLEKLQDNGYEVKKRGKQYSVRNKEQGDKARFVRLKKDTLGAEYGQDRITERIASNENEIQSDSAIELSPVNPSIHKMIDMAKNEKVLESKGYNRFASLHNLDQTAILFNYMQENNISSIEELEKTANAVFDNFNESQSQIKSLEQKLNENATLQRHIFNYSKTRDIYKAYKSSRHKDQFYNDHAKDIILHEAAKKAFDEFGVKKLPTVAQLREEYGVLKAEKNIAYKDYKGIRDKNREMQNIMYNLELENLIHMDKEKTDHQM